MVGFLALCWLGPTSPLYFSLQHTEGYWQVDLHILVGTGCRVYLQPGIELHEPMRGLAEEGLGNLFQHALVIFKGKCTSELVTLPCLEV